MNSRFARRMLCCLLLFAAFTAARAEIILTNYSAERPLKIMPLGDSITDDCTINGAWRLYLQTLLETNGYPFTFVGRQMSAPNVASNFTKVNHESYCGAVIAAPGVFGAHGYDPTNGYLMNITPEALAVVSNQPDVVLLIIGCNDIGTGRNPWTVATNHMPILLDFIFSNVPNVTVVLGKITSLQNAIVFGPPYDYAGHATNVPTYNAGLQLLVNQRRAQGQQIYFADMFSVVDFKTMFMGDHIHPRAAGHRAIANEWLARLQTITVRPDRVATAFITAGANWRYYDLGQEPAPDWTQPGYDDSGWSNGIGRFGYGYSNTATRVSYGPDPNNKYVTTYFRRSFVVPWNSVMTNLNFRLARADGAIVYLNGQEMYRTNLPDGLINYTNLALTGMTGYTAHIYYPTNFAMPALSVGTNVVAVEMHMSAVTNATLGFDLELIGSGYPVSPPALSIASAGDHIELSWPFTNNGSSFALYSATNLVGTVNWIPVMSLPQTNGGSIIVTQALDTSPRFFRLQLP